MKVRLNFSFRIARFAVNSTIDGGGGGKGAGVLKIDDRHWDKAVAPEPSPGPGTAYEHPCD